MEKVLFVLLLIITNSTLSSMNKKPTEHDTTYVINNSKQDYSCTVQTSEKLKQSFIIAATRTLATSTTIALKIKDCCEQKNYSTYYDEANNTMTINSQDHRNDS